MNAPEASDWLDDVLIYQETVPADPVFVAQVLRRLDMAQPLANSSTAEVLLAWSGSREWIVISATILLVVFTPAMAQGWLAFSQAPWSATVWSQGEFVAACLSMAVLVCGALKMAHVHLSDTMV
jgi:broad specificity phosphatase PhoE